MLNRRHGWVMGLVAGFSILGGTVAHAEQKAGNWVEYQVKNTGTRTMDNDGKPYNLKLMVTGQENGKLWYEIVTTGTKDPRKVVKFLAEPNGDLKSPTERAEPWKNVSKIIVQSGDAGPEEVPQSLMAQHSPSLVPALSEMNRNNLKVVKGPEVKDAGKEDVTVKGKKLAATRQEETLVQESKVDLHFIKLESNYDQKATASIAKEVPITGAAKLNVALKITTNNQKPNEENKPGVQNISSDLTLAGFGDSGAETLISGTPTMMQVKVPFPFLQQKGQQPAAK